VGLQSETLSTVFLLHINEDELSHKNIDDYRLASQGIDSKSILLISSDLFMFHVIFFMYIGVLFILGKVIKPYNPLPLQVLNRNTTTMDIRRANREDNMESSREDNKENNKEDQCKCIQLTCFIYSHSRNFEENV